LLDANGERARTAHVSTYDFLLDHVTDEARLEALGAAMARLEQDFGHWRLAWGEINRYQRLTGDIVQPFDDLRPSLPVGFAPGEWGALASFDSLKPRTTKRIYGSVGNSFIAAVEFGPVVRAKALMAGGESGDPASVHFSDQAQMFCDGRFRDVWFSTRDIMAHAQRRYHPGEP
jgi:acyl-homoserine-lactone acylase